MYTAKRALQDAETALEVGNQLANALSIIEAAAKCGHLSVIMRTKSPEVLDELEAAGYLIESLPGNSDRFEITWRCA